MNPAQTKRAYYTFWQFKPDYIIYVIRFMWTRFCAIQRVWPCGPGTNIYWTSNSGRKVQTSTFIWYIAETCDRSLMHWRIACGVESPARAEPAVPPWPTCGGNLPTAHWNTYIHSTHGSWGHSHSHHLFFFSFFLSFLFSFPFFFIFFVFFFFILFLLFFSFLYIFFSFFSHSGHMGCVRHLANCR